MGEDGTGGGGGMAGGGGRGAVTVGKQLWDLNVRIYASRSASGQWEMPVDASLLMMIGARSGFHFPECRK